ncbi:hypothetical protein Q3V30_22120 (plasmid) [Erwinia pyri]|uniref:Restriction endonuclease n=1 Tax=Erwinia pyri TaxID=3062598 RepID=A0AA50HSL4_9GAMM|nr:hypothetical protein [Erwinia sp. DE2]WLS81155.1 hypothetical protein Q3V30_22120 [Erwinia sp. DE2]
MSGKIAITIQELNTKEMVTILSPTPISLLDSAYPGLTPEARKQILKEKYKKRVIADGLETGHIKLTDRGYTFSSNQTASSFAGLVFEAYLVDKFNQNEVSRLRAFQWCTERAEGWSIATFKEYKAVGTGLLSTKANLLSHFEPQSNADILFIRRNPASNVMEPALIHNQSNTAAIQVKSIRSNFTDEIVNKVLSGKYRRVITMLSDETGRPSWVICHNILLQKMRAGYITQYEYADAISRIQGPEYFNLVQREIDEYYEYIRDWHRGTVHPTEHITEAASQEIVEYKYENGLLVPV